MNSRRLRERTNVLGDARIASCQRPKLGDEMRIGQEAYIEDQIGVLRNSLTESEAHAGNQNAFFRGLFLKTLGDVSAKFVHVELRSVDDEIGDRANGAQVTAFGFEGGLHRRICAQRMRAAGLAETAQQD